MSRPDFYKLFLNKLNDIYNAEHQIEEILPQMMDAATSTDLRDALTHHLQETHEQIKRLDKIFSLLRENYRDVQSAAMDGILKSIKEVLRSDNYSDFVKDAAMIYAAQCVEHFEIACYGTLRTFAEHLELDQVANLLQENLREERRADSKLTDIAEGGFFTAGVNKKAQKR